MDSPKCVEYVDEKCTIGAYYHEILRPGARVGIIPLGLDVPKNPVFMWASGLGTFRVTVFATDEIVPLGLQPNLKIA